MTEVGQATGGGRDLRVLVVSDMYTRQGMGGAGESIHRQALALQALGVAVTAIRPRPRLGRRGLSGSPRPLPSDVYEGISIVDAPFWNLPVRHAARFTARAVTRAVASRVARERLGPFDLVHAHRLFPNGLVAMSLAAELGVPAVVSARGSDVHTHPRRVPAIKGLVTDVIEGADQVLAVSRELASQIEAIATPRRPVQVVYNGVDTDRFRPSGATATLRRSLGLPAGGVGLCYVGRLVEAKGLPEMLDAFTAVAATDPTCWLAVVGDGPLLEPLRKRVTTAGLEGRVHFSGNVVHDRVPEWLQASDLFVLPSHNEGLPNVVLEAMACGLPVLATRVGGIPEAVEDERTGILVPARDTEALTRAMADLIGDGERRRRMGDEGLSRVVTRHSWSGSAERLLLVYRTLVSPGVPSR